MNALAPSTHTLCLHVQGAADWNEVEELVAREVARYFRIPRRGKYSEKRDALVAGAQIRVSLRPDGLFDAAIEVSR